MSDQDFSDSFGTRSIGPPTKKGGTIDPLVDLSWEILNIVSLNEDKITMSSVANHYYSGLWKIMAFMVERFVGRPSSSRVEMKHVENLWEYEDHLEKPKATKRLAKRVIGLTSLFLLPPLIGVHSGEELGVLLCMISLKRKSEACSRSLKMGGRENARTAIARQMIEDWEVVTSELMKHNSAALCSKFLIFCGIIRTIVDAKDVAAYKGPAFALGGSALLFFEAKRFHARRRILAFHAKRAGEQAEKLLGGDHLPLSEPTNEIYPKFVQVGVVSEGMRTLLE
jgi:hypothetical protein